MSVLTLASYKEMDNVLKIKRNLHKMLLNDMILAREFELFKEFDINNGKFFNSIEVIKYNHYRLFLRKAASKMQYKDKIAYCNQMIEYTFMTLAEEFKTVMKPEGIDLRICYITHLLFNILIINDDIMDMII